MSFFSRPISLTGQFSIIPFLIGVLTMLLLTSGYYWLTRDSYLKQTAVNLGEVSQLIAENLDRLLLEKVRVVQTLARNPALIRELKEDPNSLQQLNPRERQKRISQLNNDWKAASDDTSPVIEQRMTSPSAAVLRTHMEEFPDIYGEIFVTDLYGVASGTTGRLSTLAHAHKYWWQAVTKGGSGRIFIDDRGFDESVGDIVLGVVVPVYDEDGLHGVLKANLQIRDLLGHIIRIKHEPGLRSIAVVRSKGRIVLEPGLTPLSSSVPRHSVALMEERNLQTSHISGPTQSLVEAFAPVPLTLSSSRLAFGGKSFGEDQWRGNQGEHWSILVREFIGVSDVLGLSRFSLAIMMGLVLLSMALLSAWLGRRLSRPINEMADALDLFTTDNVIPMPPQQVPMELERLGKSITDMATEITQKTASIDELTEEIDRRKLAEQKTKQALQDVEQAYRQVVQVEKLSALGTFVGGIAHEIKNPLMGLMSYLDYARSESQDLLVKDILGRATDQIDKIDQIVSNILSYSGHTLGEPELLEMQSILDRVINLVNGELKRNNIDLQAEIADPEHEIFANRGIVEQALLNLMLNAIYAVRDKSEPSIHVRVRQQAEKTVIAVEDNGDGVPEDIAQKIFDPFFTTKPAGKGTGLGLSVTIRNLSAAGIELFLDPGYTEGARFVLVFPSEYEVK